MDNYVVQEVIGSGSFGTVSKVKRKTDGKLLVWKELNYGKMSEKEKQMLVSEVNILRELRHPNVVRYYDRIINRETTKIYIVMEHCENGDVSQLIKKCRRERTFVDESRIWSICYQIVLALYECHRRKERILHRDLKPANIFLDAHNNVKLGDFGLARVLGQESMFAYTNVGTPFYMSPEQINELAYNEKSDIWALGCVLFELAALTPPFEASNQLALAVKIKAGRVARIPERFSDDLNRAVRQMLQVEQAKRPTIEELLGVPQIAIRVRERKLAQQTSSLRKREEELQRREAALDLREKQLAAKEAELSVMAHRGPLGLDAQAQPALTAMAVNAAFTTPPFALAKAAARVSSISAEEPEKENRRSDQPSN